MGNKKIVRERLISEEVKKDINFLYLVSPWIYELNTLLASMKAIINNADYESEENSHLLNLVEMAEKKREKIENQLDMHIDGTETGQNIYEKLSTPLN